MIYWSVVAIRDRFYYDCIRISIPQKKVFSNENSQSKEHIKSTISHCFRKRRKKLKWLETIQRLWLWAAPWKLELGNTYGLLKLEEKDAEGGLGCSIFFHILSTSLCHVILMKSRQQPICTSTNKTPHQLSFMLTTCHYYFNKMQLI